MPTKDAAPEADVEVIEPVITPKAKTELEAKRLSLIDTMRDHFKDMPRRRIKVRNDADVPVQINGYTFIVAANVPVDVPVQVADMLEEAGYI
jgi:hypothetical protein